MRRENLFTGKICKLVTLSVAFVTVAIHKLLSFNHTIHTQYKSSAFDCYLPIFTGVNHKIDEVNCTAVHEES